MNRLVRVWNRFEDDIHIHLGERVLDHWLAARPCHSHWLLRLWIHHRLTGHRVHRQLRLVDRHEARLLVFVGDYAQNPALGEQMNGVGEFLARPENDLSEAVLQKMLVHASPQDKAEWDDFPLVFRPRDKRGVMNYWLIFADTPSLHDAKAGDAYETYGIRKDVGAAVLLRPDGYVAKVTEPTVDGIKDMFGFLARFLVGLKPSA